MTSEFRQHDAAQIGSPTLCDLFARSVARTPDAIALSDPRDKARIVGKEPSRLTYAQADAAVASLAAQFLRAGLPSGSIIAVQLPNTIEFVLTLLAAWRAGLVVALLPQLWRQADLTEALNRVGARAIVSTDRIDVVDHADLAMNAAAEVFSIRQVFGFGANLPDGITPLDWTVREQPSREPGAFIEARKAAIASFDVTNDGMLAVPRSHVNLITGALAIYIESGLPQGANIISTVLPSSFGGLVSSVVTWLLTGGSLSLHHPFDADTLIEQIESDACDTLIAPAPLLLRLAESGVIDQQATLRHVIGLWRTPERVASSSEWQSRNAEMTDVYLFGEVGLFGLRRLSDGTPASVKPGVYGGRSADLVSSNAGEILLTPQGTLALRGPMVAMTAYRAAQRPNSKDSHAPAADFVDTGYAARLNKQTKQIDITAAPAGLANVGGYRFRLHDLDQWAKRLAPGAVMTALPDQMNGFRLAGRTHENTKAREALAELGLNPLMADAFRQREPSA